MNTHSREADCRMELLSAFSFHAGVEPHYIHKLFECVTTEEAVWILKQSEKFDLVMKSIVERICYYMEKRSKGKLNVDCIIYTNELGELAKSEGAEKWFIL